ncbi:hypothetical protein B14911_24905 [Bacillus sp. NRRL B-14911]|nr:hypothetical protein B14911_24905 [Bacillus sp. NRRL B-14911]
MSADLKYKKWPADPAGHFLYLLCSSGGEAPVTCALLPDENLLQAHLVRAKLLLCFIS